MLQGGEIIIILLLALVVLGPRRLPEMARKLGEWTAELRSAAREVRRGLESEIADLKEIGDDLKSPVEELTKTADEVKADFDSAAGATKQEWTGPKPVSGPTPEDAMADLEEIEKDTPEEDGT
jgi:Tat protein translocase TatB subunit